MPQSKILVDANAYLRLAKTIRPLLFEPFGNNAYCLYILPELNKELEGRKLQSKFSWVDDEEFSENRKHFPNSGRKQKNSVKQTFGYVWDHVQTALPGPSRVDAWYIAYAIELDVPVVTDDQDMKTIDSLCDYWRYISDLPANFKSNYKHLFGAD